MVGLERGRQVMQVFPVLALVLYLIIAACKKEKSSGRPGAGVNSSVSLRTIFLTVLLLPQSLFLFVFFSELIHPLFSSIKIPWLGIQYALATSITFSLIYYAFPWLAWRVCRPIGLSRLSRLFFWFTPLANRKDLDNFAALLRASRGISPEPPPPEKNHIGVKIRKFLALCRRPPFVVDSWAVVMFALAREVQGDNVRAERLLRTFDLCPPGLATLGRVRRFAFEELAWHAARRRDWKTVLRRVRFAGMRMPLLKLLAEKHLGRRASRTRIWLAFLISPSRIRAFRFVLDAIKRGGEQPSMPETPSGMQTGLRLTHLRLLLKASEGTYVGMEEVLRLANSWSSELTNRKQEALLRRGMELGARDVLGLAGRIEESVLDELEEIISRATGKIPEEVLTGMKEGEASFVTKLVLRLKNRLFEDVHNIQELFKVEQGETVADKDLLERWDMWLILHESASRLQQLIGTDELATLWYGTMRNAVWNSTSRIFNASNARTAFISMIMYKWLVDVSELHYFGRIVSCERAGRG